MSLVDWQVRDLLNLDGDNTVVSSTVEELDLAAVSGTGDVLLLGTGLDEQVSDILDTLLGEVLIALLGTGLLVGITVDIELDIAVDNILVEVVEVSEFTLGEFGLAAVEVESQRRSLDNLDNSEFTILVEIGLTINEVIDLVSDLLKFSDLILKFCILLLEGLNTLLESIVLVGGEGNRDDDGSN